MEAEHVTTKTVSCGYAVTEMAMTYFCQDPAQMLWDYIVDLQPL